MDDDLQQQLAQGLAALNLNATVDQQRLLLDYLGLLQRWNAAYNLTAVRDPRQMVIRHLFDSLAVSPHVHGTTLVDVGTGPGLPGIPLAILNPHQHWWLLDSNGKKTRFLFHAKSQLGLANIDIVECRVEQWQPPEPVDAIMTRAFANLADTELRCRHLLAPKGFLYAMKSQGVDDELAALRSGFVLQRNISLLVPGLNEARWLTVLARTSDGEG